MLIGVLVIIALGYSTVYRSGPHSFGNGVWGSRVHRTDFTIYTTVGQAILDGQDIYDVASPRGWHYNNAPVFGLLFVPFALMSVFWGSLLWYILSIVLMILGIRWSTGLVLERRGSESDAFLLYTIPTLLLAWPVLSALSRGQLTPWMFAFAMAAMYFQWRGREWIGGMFLGLAVLIKVFPIFFLSYYVWKKRWHFVGATVFSILLCTLVVPVPVLGWNRNLAHLERWGAILMKTGMETTETIDPRFSELSSRQLIRNQSLEAVISRLSDDWHPRWLAGAAGLLMAGVMVWSAKRARARRDLFILSTVIVWSLLMSPVSWSHYFMLLMMPLGMLTWVARRELDAVTRRIALAALVTFGLVTLTTAADRELQAYGPLCWATLGLWIVIIVVARRMRPSSEADRGPALG